MSVACKYYIWTDAYLHDALQHIGGLKGKRVVVVGSLTPWYAVLSPRCIFCNIFLGTKAWLWRPGRNL